jgi:hypothetical protein
MKNKMKTLANMGMLNFEKNMNAVMANKTADIDSLIDIIARK